MAVTKAKKDEVLKELDDKFGRAQAVYFADYRGLSVKDVGALRNKLREEGVDYRVAKKTLMRISLQNNKLPEAPAEVMQGPVGAAFGYDDVIKAVKVLYLFSKENDKLKILGGLVDGKFITQAEALQLAQLPSREELIAKMMGSMKAPVSGLHGVLSGLLRSLVYVLKAIEEQKPQEAAPASAEKPSEEAKPEEAKSEESTPVAEEKPSEESRPEEAAAPATEEAAPSEEPKAEEKPEEPSGESAATEEEPKS